MNKKFFRFVYAAIKRYGDKKWTAARGFIEINTNDADGLGIPRYEQIAETPTIYWINVQVRCRFICFITWHTFWTASCDISDGDTRAYIENRANEVCNLINAEL